jgi:hypothetical protein
MLRTVQCRPAAACARKIPLRVQSKETRQDKKDVYVRKNQLNSTHVYVQEEDAKEIRRRGHISVLAVIRSRCNLANAYSDVCQGEQHKKTRKEGRAGDVHS